jgi:hypothetical protein
VSAEATELELELAAADSLSLLGRLIPLRLVRTIPLADPAVGAELVIPVPGGVLWELLELAVSFRASAVAGQRRIGVAVTTPNGVRSFGSWADPTHPAFLLSTYNFAAGLGRSNFGGFLGVPLPSPPLVLSTGDTLATLTEGMDPADFYAACVLTVREWSPEAIRQQAEWIAHRVRAAAAPPAWMGNVGLEAAS